MEEKKGNFWLTLAGFIVDKRKAIEILFILGIIFSVICFDKVQVNQDITRYLAEDSETRIGLTTMQNEFVTYGSVEIMLSSVTYEQAECVANEIGQIKGVKSVEFDHTEEHYRGANALISVTVEGADEDEISIATMDRIKSKLTDYDSYYSTTIGANEETTESLNADVKVILILAVVVIVIVLLLSTNAYGEIPVLLITFAVAAILNKGTNFWFGEISSVTDSIAIVLQLALAIDYAIIFCDRYMEEHKQYDSEQAVKIALSKAIPEISSSSLTTVSGMVAMMFMQFRLGYDMGIVLCKAIIFSLITVFLFMPGLLLIFAKSIDKTHHKSFVPKISFVGKFAANTKFVIPPIFLIVIIAGFFISNNCDYLYDVNSVESAKKSRAVIASEKITETFGYKNQLVVMVPVGNYEAEKQVLAKIENLPYVVSALGLSNQKINDEYVLTDKINPRKFSELADIDVEVAELLYSAYAYNMGEYGPVITGVDDYEVPIIDMFLFLYDQYEQGYVTLSDEMDKTLRELYDTLHDAQLQLQGENYTRFVLNIDLPVEGERTYEALEEIRSIAELYYGQDSTLLVGNSTSAHDLESSFANDNIVISVLTALFVMIILLFTFQSAGLPILLVATIQGSIWINFSVPSIMNQGIYFIAYLIISAIQMGATIDYAIVISSRYMVLKKEMKLKEAITETVNQAFPTIFTSGSIMVCAGFIIGNVTSDATIAAMGIALGRGTLISIILVLFVLPQILMLGNIILEKSALTIKLKKDPKEFAGRMVVTGHMSGFVNGYIDADVKGTVNGQMSVVVDSVLPGKQGRVDETNSAIGMNLLEQNDYDTEFDRGDESSLSPSDVKEES